MHQDILFSFDYFPGMGTAACRVTPAVKWRWIFPVGIEMRIDFAVALCSPPDLHKFNYELGRERALARLTKYIAGRSNIAERGLGGTAYISPRDWDLVCRAGAEREFLSDLLAGANIQKPWGWERYVQ